MTRWLILGATGTIGRELSETVLRLLPRLPGCRIDYKLHPSEVARWTEAVAPASLTPPLEART